MNLCTNHAVITHDAICAKKIYGKCFTRLEQTKAINYALRYNDDAYKGAHIQINPINSENINMDQDHRRENNTDIVFINCFYKGQKDNNITTRRM